MNVRWADECARCCVCSARVVCRFVCWVVRGVSCAVCLPTFRTFRLFVDAKLGGKRRNSSGPMENLPLSVPPGYSEVNEKRDTIIPV